MGKKKDNGYKSEEDQFDAMVKKTSPVKKAAISDDNDSDFGAPEPKKAGNGFNASDSDSDFIKDSPPPKPKKEPKKAPKKKLQNFGGNSDDEDGFGAKPAKKAKKAAAPKPKAPPKAKAPAKSKAKKAKGGAKKSKKGSDSDDASFDLSNIAPARDRPGRQKKAVNYQNFDDDDSDEDF